MRPPGEAPGLPDQATFRLLHCGAPMRFYGNTLVRDGDCALTWARFRCDRCDALLELSLTERA